MRDRLDATHDDGLKVQELDTHALVNLERDARRIGTVRHQARGGMKRGSVGILILKTTGIGHQPHSRQVAMLSLAVIPQSAKKRSMIMRKQRH